MTDLSPFAQAIFRRTYAFHENETWDECAARVAKAIALDDDQEKRFFEMIRDRVFIPGGRYLYAAGRKIPAYMNCWGFVAGDSREDWADLLRDVTLCLSTGGGLGVNYSAVRGLGTPIKRMGGTASGPLALMQMVNEVARHVMSGGKRRSALWAGLNWDHSDIDRFISVKDWDPDVIEMKSKRYEYPAPLDMTNVSVIVGDRYLALARSGDLGVLKLHRDICERMIRTGEPAFLNLSRRLDDDPLAYTANACCESCLRHRDSCNLGSIVMPRIRDLSHLEEVTRMAIQFLYNGSMKSWYPTDSMRDVGKINRRLGLGVMGLHEYMLLQGHRYEWFDGLDAFFDVWSGVSQDESVRYSSIHGRRPVNTRAIAPTGTISIVAETTSGIEPIFCKAYKRRYIDGSVHRFQYVVDPTVRRLTGLGVSDKLFEDAHELSLDFERRLDVQAQIQRCTDQAISNTINLPEPSEHVNGFVDRFSAAMLKYLPMLKGVTVYPNGARPGQPLVPVDLEEALSHEGVVFEEDGDRCLNGVCGT